MAGETQVTVWGNLTADPELRFTPEGRAVANFTVAQTPRTYNRQSNSWDDGTTMFMRCSIWGEYAENVAESLHRGERVIAVGRLKQRSWEATDGSGTRTVIEMDVDEVGPALRFVTSQIRRATRASDNPGQGQQGNQGQQGQQGQWGQQQGQGQPQQGQQQQNQGQWGQGQQGGGDPWATGGGGWGGGAHDPTQPPF